MNKKPVLNGLLASVYIFIVSMVMTFGGRLANKPDTFFAPVLFISLFTLSAAIMGYLFVFEPIQLLIAGKKQQAVKHFLQTTGTFGLITLVVLALVFSEIF